MASQMDSTATAHSTTAARSWHWSLFAVGVFGVVTQLWVVATQPLTEQIIQLSAPIRVWNVLSYFTIWSNILVVVVALLLARSPHRSGPMFNTLRLASVVMITITGLIFALVLEPIWESGGWQRVADVTLHYVVPPMAVIGFLLFGPRPQFSRTTLWGSLAIPLAWVAYTLIRSPFITYTENGVTGHWYPYPFIDVDDIGYGRALGNIAAIFLLLVVMGGLYVFLDRKLPRRPTDKTRAGT